MSDKVRVTSIEPVTSNHEPIPYRFTPVPEAMLYDPEISVELKGFLSILISYSRPKQGKLVIWPGIEALAKICGCSTRKVRRMLEAAVKLKLVERKRRIGTSSVTSLGFIERYKKCLTNGTNPSPTDEHGLSCKVDVVEADVEETETSIVAERRVATTEAPSKAESFTDFCDRAIYSWNTIIAEPYGRPRVTARSKAITDKLRSRRQDPNWEDPEAVMRSCVPLSDFMAGGGDFGGITMMTLVQNAKGAQNALDGQYRRREPLKPPKPQEKPDMIDGMVNLTKARREAAAAAERGGE
ncbi:MAG TPA: hypothetical protein VMX94_07125 [Armatimonadota bacterium]|nr:hypothetical protein [Armatimonadota bacterium]